MAWRGSFIDQLLRADLLDLRTHQGLTSQPLDGIFLRKSPGETELEFEVGIPTKDILNRLTGELVALIHHDHIMFEKTRVVLLTLGITTENDTLESTDSKVGHADLVFTATPEFLPLEELPVLLEVFDPLLDELDRGDNHQDLFHPQTFLGSASY